MRVQASHYDEYHYDKKKAECLILFFCHARMLSEEIHLHIQKERHHLNLALVMTSASSDSQNELLLFKLPRVHISQQNMQVKRRLNEALKVSTERIIKPVN